MAERIGCYEIRGELGHGAMARVWRAWDPRLEREVAIKEPLYDPNLSPQALEELGRRFVAEGRTAARLTHPGVVTVYEAGVWDGRPAIVMELVEGATLSQVLLRGSLAPSEALSILDQLLDAIGYAHDHGVVHRDIKPDNIFVTNNGVVKLADFGIAHVDGGTTHATVVGTVLGTPGYLSPEQARGDAVTSASDLFSIGVVAYEMLAGHNPFGAGEGIDATTLIYRIVYEPVVELPDVVCEGVPADLRPAIMAALSKQPEGRPASAAEFKAMLHGTAVSRFVEPRQGIGDYPMPTESYGTVLRSRPVIQNTTTSMNHSAVRSTKSWMPYVVIGIVCTVAIVAAFVSATSSGSGFVAETVSQSTPSEIQMQGEQGGTESGVPDVEAMTDVDAITYLDPDDVPPDGYVIPDSSTHWYSEDELEQLTDKQLYYGRNEILARYGRGFYTPILTEYFETKTWYTMRYTAEEWAEMYSTVTMPCNQTETHNYDLMFSIEDRRDSPYI